MKERKVKRVIEDLRNLFEIDKTGNRMKDSLEQNGTFFICKWVTKRKVAKEILENYLAKTSIKNGDILMKDKSLVYSLIFKVYEKEKEKG